MLKNWRTVPNLISVIRLVILVPVVIVLMSQAEHRIPATVALVIFGGTDWVDGFWARTTGQVSRLGEILDPVADRVGILCICVAMTAFEILPLWILLVIVLTDLVLGVIGLTRMQQVRQGRVSWLGKIRTAVLMTGLPFLLAGTDPVFADTPLATFGLFLLSVGTLLHLGAGTQYALRLLRPQQMRSHSRVI